MKKIILLVLLTTPFFVLAIDSPILSQQQMLQINHPVVVRVYFDNREQLDVAAQSFAFWEINHQQNYAVIDIQNQKDFTDIDSMGLTIRIDKKLTDQYFRNAHSEQHAHPHSSAFGSGIVGFSCYSTVEETFVRMQSMVDNYPTLAEMIDIGDSWEKINLSNNGYDLNVLKLTNQSVLGDKPKVFIMSAVHAREYATAELTTRFAEFLLQQYDSNPDIRWMLDHHELHLLLQANPDGRKMAETGLLWRKNTNQNYCDAKSNSRGADLNRNFPFEWGVVGAECTDVYAGPSAASEPEVDALMTYVRTLFPDERDDSLTAPAPLDKPGIFLDVHSFSQLVLWPWGISFDDAPNAAQFRALGKRVAFFNDYNPQPIHDLTIATGSSVDTAYGELGVASLAFELGTNFFQDCATFEQTIAPDNIQALLYALRTARRPYQAPSGPDVKSIQLSSSLLIAGDVLTITANATDDDFNQSNGTQAVQAIALSNVYMDALPWVAGSAPIAMTAADGSFDSSSEVVSADIDTSGMSSGTYTLYFQAADVVGAVGPVYATEFSVVRPEDAATLSGQIRDANSGAPVDMAALTFNTATGSSSDQGMFSLVTLADTGDLVVSASDYQTKVLQDITTVSGTTVTQNVMLEPFCDVLFDDVENGDGEFTADTPWARTTGRSNSPDFSWTDSPNGGYSNNQDTRLTSEVFEVSQTQGLTLEFAHWCDTENGFDFGMVEVNYNGSGWESIYQCSDQAFWDNQSIVLSDGINVESLQFRFRFTSDETVTRDGWYVDDVRLRGAGLACRTKDADIIFANSFE